MTHAMQARAIAATGHFADTETSYFTVFVGDEVFGLPVRKTQTIFRIGSITTVPGGPSDIAGLVNLRGKIVTAVSLRHRLRIPCDGPFTNALAITIEHKGECFGLIVDRVGDVLTLDPSKQIPVPPHFDAERLRLTQGLYRLEDLLVPVLDIDAVFDFAT